MASRSCIRVQLKQGIDDIERKKGNPCELPLMISLSCYSLFFHLGEVGINHIVV